MTGLVGSITFCNSSCARRGLAVTVPW